MSRPVEYRNAVKRIVELWAEADRLREALEEANAAFLRGDPDEAYAAVRRVIGRKAPEGSGT